MLLRRCPRSLGYAVSRGFIRHGSSLSKAEISEILSKPTWSLKSLIPPKEGLSNSPEVNPAQLRHLLRLSALPQPRSSEEEADMLKTLSSQIHFVKEIQAVDTIGVEPLQALRDETNAGIERSTIGLEQMKPYLEQEEVVGRNGRIRRKKTAEGGQTHREFENWDPLELAQEKRGRYFVVTRANTRETDSKDVHDVPP